MELKEALAEIYKAAHKEFNFENVPSLHLRQDDENAQGIFGKTPPARRWIPLPTESPLIIMSKTLSQSLGVRHAD